MRVMVIVKATASSERGEMPSEQLFRDMAEYNQQLVNAGIMQAGEGLHPTSKAARVRFSGNNRTVIDGPFAETKELIAGYWLWKVKSLEEAIEWVKKCPNPHPEESEIEIRPIFESDDFGEAFTPELREKEGAMRAQTLGLEPPQFVDGKAMKIAGINAHYTAETRHNIPEQWHRFAPQIGKVPGQVGTSAYGVCWNYQPPCTFDYLAGVEVKDGNPLPADYQQVDIPARRYAVFAHRQHVSEIPKTLDTIWAKWLPESGLKAAAAPCFERYTEEFNPETGKGGTEIWIPLE